ncbi:hypothetical protein OF83DRAFT_1280764 [Amylostereum chailletii]|nr:hypothetical protein OF83DRAFT_1280764 [Amylostereum chailletii]
MWDSRGPDSLKLPLTTPVEMTSDDYVNASYVQPLGTTKRYIATQGPLPETFVDFWTLVWEQNVHVIVMLTREVEGATVKSGNYWSATRFGPLRLKLVSTTASGGPEGEAQRAQQPQSGFFFPTHHSPPKHPGRSDSDDSSEGMDRDSTIRRVLELSHSGYPHLPPRRVVHLQYLEWPDMNVPDDPKGILRLIREVEKQVDKSEKERGPWEGLRRPDQWRRRPKPGAILPMGASGSTSNEGSPGSGKSGSGGKSTDDEDAVDEQNGIMKHALCERPVLLHCSAGVGRTGGFIAVDAVLDGVRREMRKRRSGVPVPSLVTEPPSDSAPSGTSGGGSLQGARSGDSADNEQSGENENSGGGSSGLGSRASVSGKETPGSGEEVMPMDVDLEKDEDSAGGRAHAHSGPGLVMSLPIAAGGDRAVHVPVVGIRAGPTTPPPTGQRGQALVPMDVDKPSPWRANDPRHAVQQWTPGFGAGSIAATPPPPSAASRESVLSPSRDSALSASPAPPASSAVSRSMSPEDSESGSGESGSASSGGFPLFPSATRPPFPPTRSTMGGSRSLQGVAAANRTSLRTSSTLGGPLASMSLPSDGLRLGSPFVEVPRKTDPPVIPPLSTVDSDSSSSLPSSNPPSSLFSLPRSVTLSSPLPTSREDSKSASVSSLELKGKMRSDSKGSEENVKSALSMRGMQIPLERMETVKPLIPALPSKTPPDYMMVSRSESQSQSQSQAQSQSPPTFDYTLPRVLHDDRHSPTLLSSLDEPIRRVIEDMREQRMSLCQSLRQYVFVHRAVIEGVLMLIDEERAMYGEAWMDVDEEQELRVSVGKEMDIGAGPMVRPGMGVLKHSSGTTGTTNSSSPSKHKRGPSPTELAREDPMGGVRLSKRPSIKRKVRSSDEDDAAAFQAKSGMGS